MRRGIEAIGELTGEIRSRRQGGQRMAEILRFLHEQGADSDCIRQYLRAAFFVPPSEVTRLRTMDLSLVPETFEKWGAMLDEALREPGQEWQSAPPMPVLMSREHHSAFKEAAVSSDCCIIVCGADPAGGAYLGRSGFRVALPGLPAWPRRDGPNQGLLAVDPGDARLAAELQAAGRTYDELVDDLKSRGFQVAPAADGFLLRDAFAQAFYPPYRLHGVYSFEGANGWTPQAGPRLMAELNLRLGDDLIQAGPHDAWEFRNDPRAGPLAGPQPPVVAFEPSGSVKPLPDLDAMKEFYQGWSIDWDAIYPPPPGSEPEEESD